MTENILAALAAVFGGGWIAQILFMNYEKRKKAAETKGAEMEIDEKEDRLRDEKLSKAYDQIVNLQFIVDTERNKWVEIAKELSTVKRELLREKEARELAEYEKCTVSACPRRQPPRIRDNG